jgi:hypothetical protein
MKSLLSFTFLLVGLLVVKAQQYKPVDEKSDIKFYDQKFWPQYIRHFKGFKRNYKF